MRDENVLPTISHRSLPNPSKTEVLLVRLPVLSHAEHKTIASARQLYCVCMGQMQTNPAPLLWGAQHPPQLDLQFNSVQAGGIYPYGEPSMLGSANPHAGGSSSI